jgi:DNA-binding transcriptional MerR regulator
MSILSAEVRSASEQERLKIGQVAGLLGVTTKTIRHYEKVGLLGVPERSGSGYRLYTADHLLRLYRIKKLQSLGFSLGRIKSLLGESGSGNELRNVLEALLREVEEEIRVFERRRERLREMLAREDLENVPGQPHILKVSEMHLGEYLKDLDPSLVRQAKKFWETLDVFDWPEEYRTTQEALVVYLAERPQAFEAALALEERLAALIEAPVDSPEVEQLARDLIRYQEEYPFPEDFLKAAPWSPGPMGGAFRDLMMAAFSPAQRRCVELAQKWSVERNDAP